MDEFQIYEAILEHTVILNDPNNIAEIGGLDRACNAILAMHNQEVTALKERVDTLEETLLYIKKIAQNSDAHPMDRVYHIIHIVTQLALAEQVSPLTGEE